MCLKCTHVHLHTCAHAKMHRCTKCANALFIPTLWMHRCTNAHVNTLRGSYLHKVWTYEGAHPSPPTLAQCHNVQWIVAHVHNLFKVHIYASA